MKRPQSHRTYSRVALRQRAPKNLERFLVHRQRISVPVKIRIRGGDIAGCAAWQHASNHTHVNETAKITLHLCPGGSPAVCADTIQAIFSTSPGLLHAAQEKSAWSLEV
jgi:hypothetical protein